MEIKNPCSIVRDNEKKIYTSKSIVNVSKMECVQCFQREVCSPRMS